MTFKITFQNRILLGRKVVRFESRCRIQTLEVRGQRCLSPTPGPKKTPAASVGSEGGAGHQNLAERLGHCPSSHPEGGPHPEEPPAQALVRAAEGPAHRAEPQALAAASSAL